MRIGDWSSDLCSSDLITLEEGTLRDFIALLARNYPYLESNPLVKLGFALGGHVRRLTQYNPIGKAQKNVAHHYDLISEERRVGKGCVSKCRSRWSTFTSKKTST